MQVVKFEILPRCKAAAGALISKFRNYISNVVLGVVIVAGVVCVALAPATGGASLIVPLAGCV